AERIRNINGANQTETTISLSQTMTVASSVRIRAVVLEEEYAIVGRCWRHWRGRCTHSGAQQDRVYVRIDGECSGRMINGRRAGVINQHSRACVRISGAPVTHDHAACASGCLVVLKLKSAALHIIDPWLKN